MLLALVMFHVCFPLSVSPTNENKLTHMIVGVIQQSTENQFLMAAENEASCQTRSC